MDTPTKPPLDPDAARLMQAMMDSGAPPIESLDPATAREAAAIGLAPLAGAGPQDVTSRDLSIDGPHGPIPLRLYRPAGAAPDATLPMLLFWHGGGFVLGGIPAAEGLCRQLSAQLCCMVVSAGYRLAPEFKFPVQIEEAQAALHWVAEHAAEIGGDALRIAVGGESAGATLAAVTALAERDRAAVTIAAQLLLYPVTDMSASRSASPSYLTYGRGYFLSAPLMDYLLGHYLRRPEDGADWRASPLRAANHAGLPGAVIAVCGYDPLHDEGLAYAEKLRSAGVAVDLAPCDSQMHAFLTMDAAIPTANAALEDIARRFRRIWGV